MHPIRHVATNGDTARREACATSVPRAGRRNPSVERGKSGQGPTGSTNGAVSPLRGRAGVQSRRPRVCGASSSACRVETLLDACISVFGEGTRLPVSLEIERPIAAHRPQTSDKTSRRAGDGRVNP